jgi:hypothetical protein
VAVCDKRPLQRVRQPRLLLAAGVTHPPWRHGIAERRFVHPAAGAAQPDEDPVAEAWTCRSGLPMRRIKISWKAETRRASIPTEPTAFAMHRVRPHASVHYRKAQQQWKRHMRECVFFQCTRRGKISA